MDLNPKCSLNIDWKLICELWPYTVPYLLLLLHTCLVSYWYIHLGCLYSMMFAKLTSLISRPKFNLNKQPYVSFSSLKTFWWVVLIGKMDFYVKLFSINLNWFSKIFDIILGIVVTIWTTCWIGCLSVLHEW